MKSIILALFSIPLGVIGLIILGTIFGIPGSLSYKGALASLGILFLFGGLWGLRDSLLRAVRGSRQKRD